MIEKFISEVFLKRSSNRIYSSLNLTDIIEISIKTILYLKNLIKKDHKFEFFLGIIYPYMQ